MAAALFSIFFLSSATYAQTIIRESSVTVKNLSSSDDFWRNATYNNTNDISLYLFFKDPLDGGTTPFLRESLWKFSGIDNLVSNIIKYGTFESDFINCGNGTLVSTGTIGFTGGKLYLNSSVESWTNNSLIGLPSHHTNLGIEIKATSAADATATATWAIGPSGTCGASNDDPIVYPMLSTIFSSFYSANENLTIIHEGYNGINQDGAFVRHSSVRNSIPAQLRFNTTLFRTVRVETSNSRFLLYDFQNNTLKATNTSTAFDNPTSANLEGIYDFVLDTSNNILKIGSAVGAQREADSPAGLPVSQPTSILETRRCSAESYVTDPIYDIGAEMPNFFRQICFDLSDQHGDRAFYGVFQMVNSTCPNIFGCDGLPLQNNGRDVEIFLAFLSPENFQVDFNFIVPNQPQAGDTVEFDVVTTKNATGFIQYRKADADANFSNISVFSGWFVLNGSANKTLHRIKLFNVSDDTFYQFFAYAEDNSGSVVYDNNTDLYYNFTVGVAGIVEPGFDNATLVEGARDFAEATGISFSNAVYFFSFIVIIITVVIAFLAGGFNAAIAAFIVELTAFAIVGLLPVFLLIPMLVLASLLVAYIIKKLVIG